MRFGIITTLFLAAVTSVSAKDKLFVSWEEDFVRNNATGLPSSHVTDGDLIDWAAGSIYMTNAQLLSAFPFINLGRQDLGLDAADVINEDKKLVVFSTEEGRGPLTGGDLLCTNGGVIKNAGLLAKFPGIVSPNITQPMGLDAVQMIGKNEAIQSFLEYVKGLPLNYYELNPLQLSQDLTQWGIDIWFSTEINASLIAPQTPLFLDGDVLSAKSGTIVVPQSGLFSLAYAAGIPNRGMDFGLDGLIAPRTGDKAKIYFSTEVLNVSPLFTDGDLLSLGGTIAVNYSTLASPSAPPVRFLGLDAVSYFDN